MLLFLNVDCLFAGTADDAEPRRALALVSLASTLHAWPRLRLVIASEHRYHMTLAQLRMLLPAVHQHRVIATTLIYGGLSGYARLTREAEILDWLQHADAEAVEWLALDNRVDDYGRHAGRLVACSLFTPEVAADLQSRLLLLATPGDALDETPRRVADPVYADEPGLERIVQGMRAEAFKRGHARAGA